MFYSFSYLQPQEAFFEDASNYDDKLMFPDMNLSRPILKVGHVHLEIC